MSTEADTGRQYVLPRLVAAGWDGDPHSFTDGRIVVAGGKVRRGRRKRAGDLPGKAPRCYHEIAVNHSVRTIVQGTRRTRAPSLHYAVCGTRPVASTLPVGGARSMSQKERVTIACPQCGCSQPATVWYSLNVSVDPDDKKALLDGEINRFHCRECNASASLETPFMYHDMDREFVVQYLPPALLHDPNLPQRFDQNGAQRVPDSVLAQMPEYMRRPHLVLSMEELVRYVVFRDRFPVTRTRDPG